MQGRFHATMRKKWNLLIRKEFLQVTFDEEKAYINAKFDIIKAKNSLQKIKPEYQ